MPKDESLEFWVCCYGRFRGTLYYHLLWDCLFAVLSGITWIWGNNHVHVCSNLGARWSSGTRRSKVCFMLFSRPPGLGFRA